MKISESMYVPGLVFGTAIGMLGMTIVMGILLDFGTTFIIVYTFAWLYAVYAAITLARRHES